MKKILTLVALAAMTLSASAQVIDIEKDGSVVASYSTDYKAVLRKKTKATKGTEDVTDATGGSRTSCAWVQLWENGPKFAAFNVGATITDYKDAGSTSSIASDKYKSPDYVGGYYGWGYNGSNTYYSGTEYDDNGNLKSDYDTAYKLWGSNWRMPTMAELNNLRNYNDDGTSALSTPLTTWTWCSGAEGSQYVEGCTLAGYKVTGATTGYTNNSVFFPVAGYNDTDHGEVGSQGGIGFYWSTTPDVSNSSACYLHITESGQSKSYYYCGYGCSVRAVLK